MELKECKDCYYKGTEKCFYYNEKFEKLKIVKCTEGFIDPYEYNNRENISKKPIDKSKKP